MMTLNSEPPRLTVTARASAPGAGLLGRFLGAILALALVVVGVVFSAVLLALVVVIGAAAFGWFWWRTREARRQWRESMAGADGVGSGGGTTGEPSVRGGGVERPAWRRSAPGDVSDAKVLGEETRVR